MSRIDADRGRFRDIVRQKVKNNLKDFIGREEIIGSQGGKSVHIPLDYIAQPVFSFGPNGGSGSGSGELGDGIDGNGKKGKGKGKEGGKDGSGDGSLGAEFNVAELASIIKEHLELKDIEPRGAGKMDTEKHKYTGISNVGNEGLRHGPRTFKQAIRRSISEGSWDPENPSVIVRREDKRYRTANVIDKPDVQARIFFLRDISGSMDKECVHMCKAMAFWIDVLLRDHYKNIETTWAVFDTASRECTKDEFFRVNSGGGTMISSGLNLIKGLLETKYPYANSNNYVHLMSDGDEFHGDSEECLRILSESIIPGSNQFCYTQVKNPIEGGFYESMKILESNPKVAMAPVMGEQDILPAIKTFFTPKG